MHSCLFVFIGGCNLHRLRMDKLTEKGGIMMKLFSTMLVVFYLAPLGLLARAADSPFAFTKIGDTGLQLAENGKPVYVYNFGDILKPGFPEHLCRSTYLHPVYALPDGTPCVTDDFNKDHPHHRGIFWAWE